MPSFGAFETKNLANYAIFFSNPHRYRHHQLGLVFQVVVWTLRKINLNEDLKSRYLEIRAWRDFSISKILVRIRLISSRSPISKHETWKKISRSRLEPWDIDKKISFSSRTSRFRGQNSRSRLEPWDWERQNLEKWKDSISFVGVVCKALIDPVARFLLPFSHSECKWLETGLNFDCQVGVWRL